MLFAQINNPFHDLIILITGQKCSPYNLSTHVKGKFFGTVYRGDGEKMSTHYSERTQRKPYSSLIQFKSWNEESFSK